jgi:hypothetical protein
MGWSSNDTLNEDEVNSSEAGVSVHFQMRFHLRPLVAHEEGFIAELPKTVPAKRKSKRN